MDVLATEKIAYTPEEAAQALGVSRRSVFKEIAAGRLEARKPFPKKTLIPAPSLRGWLAQAPLREVRMA
jgi:excisionase family DNA binding protein